MKNKKLLALLIGTLVLSGCGPKPSENPTDEPTQHPSVEEPTTVEPTSEQPTTVEPTTEEPKKEDAPKFENISLASDRCFN